MDEAVMMTETVVDNAGVVLLAVICLLAMGAMFWLVVFSDFSASADFVYNQFR